MSLVLVSTIGSPLVVAPVTVPIMAPWLIAMLEGEGVLGGVAETMRTLIVVPGGSFEVSVPLLGPGTGEPGLIAFEALEVKGVGVTPDTFPVLFVLVFFWLVFSSVGETGGGPEWPLAPVLSKPLFKFDIPAGFVRDRKTVAFAILPCVRFEVSPLTCDAWV